MDLKNFIQNCDDILYCFIKKRIMRIKKKLMIDNLLIFFTRDMVFLEKDWRKKNVSNKNKYNKSIVNEIILNSVN